MKVIDAKYACPYHSTEAEEYVGIGDPLTMADALSRALALTKKVGKDWVMRFLQAL